MTVMIRECPQYGVREDSYRRGQLAISTYTNYQEGTRISLLHGTRTYRRLDLPKDFRPAQRSEDPRPRLKKALAGEHQKLGRRTIDGIETEGIEVRDATGVNASFQIDSVVTQFWSSVATGCPILVTQTVTGNNGAIRMTRTTDQFRWDVPFDPNEFQAKIPRDYQPLSMQAGQGGRGFGRDSKGGAAGAPKSGPKTRK